MLEPTWNFIFVIPTRDRREQGGICCSPGTEILTTCQKMAFEVDREGHEFTRAIKSPKIDAAFSR
jgi:hypothetical protein